jgi:hypothetical protein
MSKETMGADYCPGCGGHFAFLANHVPHCKHDRLATAPLPRGLQAIADGLAAAGRAMGHAPELAKEAAEATVRNAKVADLIGHGPIPDTPKKKRGKRMTDGKRPGKRV